MAKGREESKESLMQLQCDTRMSFYFRDLRLKGAGDAAVSRLRLRSD